MPLLRRQTIIMPPIPVTIAYWSSATISQQASPLNTRCRLYTDDIAVSRDYKARKTLRIDAGAMRASRRRGAARFQAAGRRRVIDI